MAHDIQASVKDYYGKVLASKNDLKTSACCSTEALPARHKEILSKIDDEVLARFYGCGSPIPTSLEGTVVLDLGCGTGRDVFLAAALVGERGKVIGVDMTEEQLEVARRYVGPTAERFGFAQPNVELHQGFIEDLAGAGVADNSVDVVISNCVINLSPDKPRVLAEIMRVLKPGGELYFSDVFADRRIPEHLKEDETLYGECLSGALYTEDFRRMMADLGCLDVRVVDSRTLDVEDEALAAKVKGIHFTSQTVRAFKLSSLEDRCEDYGQTVVYQGGIEEMPERFVLDEGHTFEVGKPMAVCGNTASMIAESRLGRFFQVRGDRAHHYGLFDCSPGSVSSSDTACCTPVADKSSGGCC